MTMQGNLFDQNIIPNRERLSLTQLLQINVKIIPERFLK